MRQQQRLPREEVKRRVEEYLEALPRFNLLTTWYVISMSFCWSLTALPILSPAFSNEDTHDDFGSIQKDFDMDDSDFFRSSEFDVILYFIAAMLFATLGPTLSDKFGRRPVVAISLLVLGVACIGSAVSPSYPIFLITRAIQGAMYSGTTTVNYVFVVESLAPSRHNIAALSIGIGWTIGYVLLSPLSLCVLSWRGLFYIYGIPMVIFAVIVYFTLPESLLHSAINGHDDKVEVWRSRANGNCCCVKEDNSTNKQLILRRSPTDVFTVQHESDTEDAKDFDSGNSGESVIEIVKELGKERKLLLWMLIVSIIWSCDMMIYSGISVTSTALDIGNWRINFALGGLMELPSLILMPVLMKWFGVKHIVMVLHFLAGITMIAIFVLAILDPIRTLGPLYIVLFCACKFAFASMEIAHTVYTSSIFPPNLRGTCIGACVTIKMIGLVVYPLTLRLEGVLRYLSFALYGAISLGTVLLAIPLPNPGPL